MGLVPPIVGPATFTRPTITPTTPAPAPIAPVPAPIDRFDAANAQRPIVIYIGPADSHGAEIATFLRGQGYRVDIRDTSRDPRAAAALRALLLARGETNLPLPVIDFHLEFMRPISWDSDVPHFQSVMWPWLRNTLRDATGTTSTAEAVPTANAIRDAAMALLRRPSGVLPPAHGIFGAHGARPLSSAIDQVLGMGANVGEGIARMTHGMGGPGARQLFAGLAQLPFAILAVPIAALESGTQLAIDAVANAFNNAHGAAKFFLAILLALTAVILGPIRVITFVLGSLIVRPLSFLGQWLAERIGGPEFSRTTFSVIPAELNEPSGNGFVGIERSNENNRALADPETWMQHFAEAMNGEYRLPSPLIRELSDLREHDRSAYDRLRTQLADAGIQCFYRFPNLALLQQTLRDRTATDDRPIALVVASPADHNASFMTLSTTLSQLGESHRLVYIEAIDDQELATAIARYGSTRPISTLVIAGHGSEETTDLGGEFSMSGRGYLDVADDTRFEPLRPFLADGAHVVLESCSTGHPVPHGENVAEMLHRIWPQTIVHAPRDPDRNAGYVLDARGRVTGTRSFSGSMRTFR